MQKLNEAVDQENKKESGAEVCYFTEQEFLIGLGIMIATAGFNCRGCKHWKTTNQDNENLQDTKSWVTVNESPDFGKFMGENIFTEYRKFVAKIWERKDDQDTDAWWGSSSSIDEFNGQHKLLVCPSN
jgi:hypothetical protein